MSLGRIAQIAGLLAALVTIITFVFQFDWNREKLIYKQGSAVHIGDEEFSTNAESWVSLHADRECLKIQLPNGLDHENLQVEYESFGLENADVSINKQQPIPLPPQRVKRGDDDPNYWSLPQKIVMPIAGLHANRNLLSICARESPRAKRAGDIDDFQLREVLVTAN